MIRKSVSRQALLLLFVSVLAWPARASAGGGPENVLVVVNPRSQDSLCIANYYAKLRQIPADNLLFLPWDPQADTTDIDTFRRQILSPILHLIENRRLGGQIDAIVYSSDFPWCVNFDADIAKFLPDPEVDKYLEELRRLAESQGEQTAGQGGRENDRPARSSGLRLLGTGRGRSTG